MADRRHPPHRREASCQVRSKWNACRALAGHGGALRPERLVAARPGRSRARSREAAPPLRSRAARRTYAGRAASPSRRRRSLAPLPSPRRGARAPDARAPPGCAPGSRRDVERDESLASDDLPARSGLRCRPLSRKLVHEEDRSLGCGGAEQDGGDQTSSRGDHGPTPSSIPHGSSTRCSSTHSGCGRARLRGENGATLTAPSV